MLRVFRSFFKGTEASDQAIYGCFRLLTRVEGFKPQIYTLPSKFPLAGATFGLGVDVGQWKREELEKVIESHWKWACEFVFRFSQVFEVHSVLADLAQKASFATDPKSYILNMFDLERDALLGAVKNLFLLKNPDLRRSKIPQNSFVATLPISLAVLKHFVNSLLSIEREIPEGFLPIAVAICWQNGISGGRKRYSEVFEALRSGNKTEVENRIQIQINFGVFPERWRAYLQWLNSEV